MSSRFTILVIVLIAALLGCDDSRIYETNAEISDQLWEQDSLLFFDFEIKKTKQQYNLLANIQYSNEFEYRNLYMTYTLYDSTGKVLDESLINTQLFSKKLGKPLGNSPIGDLYEIQRPLLSQYQFPGKGKYRMSFQQYMRIDSLYHITSVGLRIEKSSNDE